MRLLTLASAFDDDIDRNGGSALATKRSPDLLAAGDPVAAEAIVGSWARWASPSTTTRSPDARPA
jgi:hypothetical protein